MCCETRNERIGKINARIYSVGIVQRHEGIRADKLYNVIISVGRETRLYMKQYKYPLMGYRNIHKSITTRKIR